MSDYLTHVTMVTGHTAHQHRWAVTNRSVKHVSGLLREALAGGCPAVVDGCTIRATASGSTLLVTLMDGNTPLLTTGVARRSRSAPRLWSAMIAAARVPLAVKVEDRPPAPWIADLHYVTSQLRLDVTAWTGDWARTVGWAWMEMTDDPAD